jgi:hypothetical protein
MGGVNLSGAVRSMFAAMKVRFNNTGQKPCCAAELIDDGVKGRAIDDMEQLEAQVNNDDAAQSAGVGSGGGTLVSGFVSAGVVQQSVPQKDGIAASATGLAMGASPWVWISQQAVLLYLSFA